MRRFVQKYKWPLIGVALAAVLALCAWAFGWFGGTIDVMDFTAEDVECIELYHYWLGEEKVRVTEKGDIQALIDEVNGFRHTGKTFKDPGYWFPHGGELPYEIRVFFSGGGIYMFSASPMEARLDVADMEMSYGGWNTCRGSLALFYELHEKYSIENPA